MLKIEGASFHNHVYEKEPGRDSEIQVSFTGPNVYPFSKELVPRRCIKNHKSVIHKKAAQFVLGGGKQYYKLLKKNKIEQYVSSD